jgi:hypothetical protein
MLYVIAILLLILVLANQTARSILGVGIVGAFLLAVGVAILLGLVILGVWIFSPQHSPQVSTPKVTSQPALTVTPKQAQTVPPQQAPTVTSKPASAASDSPLTDILAIAAIVALVAWIIVDQYRFRKI